MTIAILYRHVLSAVTQNTISDKGSGIGEERDQVSRCCKIECNNERPDPKIYGMPVNTASCVKAIYFEARNGKEKS